MVVETVDKWIVINLLISSPYMSRIDTLSPYLPLKKFFYTNQGVEKKE